MAGIDVHRMKHVVNVLNDDAAGNLTSETREFGGFKRDLKALKTHGYVVKLGATVREHAAPAFDTALLVA